MSGIKASLTSANRTRTNKDKPCPVCYSIMLLTKNNTYECTRTHTPANMLRFPVGG